LGDRPDRSLWSFTDSKGNQPDSLTE